MGNCSGCKRRLRVVDHLTYLSGGTGFCLRCAQNRAQKAFKAAGGKTYVADWQMRVRHAEEAAYLDDEGELNYGLEDDYSEESAP